MMIRTRNVGGLDGTQARVLHDGIGMGLAVVELGGLVGGVGNLVGVLVANLLPILLGDDLLVLHLVAMLVDLDGLLGRLLLLLLLGGGRCREGGGKGRGGLGIGLGDDGGGRLLGGACGVVVSRAVLGLDGGGSSRTGRDLGRAGGTRDRGMVGVGFVAGISGSGRGSGGKDLGVGLVASGDGLGIAAGRNSSDGRGAAAGLEGKGGGIHGNNGSDERMEWNWIKGMRS